MTGRFVQGWQVVLADLSLILFITTAAALDPAATPKGQEAAPIIAAPAEPVAVWRAGPGQDFAGWLHRYGPDPRERLTIAARYAPGGRTAAAAAAAALAAAAERRGIAPRLIVEPGNTAELTAVFAFDGAATPAGSARLAQPLHGSSWNASRR